MPDPHLSAIRHVPDDPERVCEECSRIGQRWISLRQCMTCGHVGCCDSSIGKHATRHFRETQHPIMRSLMPGQDWGWCYLDQRRIEPRPVPAPAS